MARKFILVEVDTEVNNKSLANGVKERMDNVNVKVIQVHVNTAKKEKKS